MTAASPLAVSGRLDPGELRRAAGSMGPWQRPHASQLVLMNLAGLGLIALGWARTNSSEVLEDRLGSLVICAAGLALAGLGNGMWLGRGRESIALARRAVATSVAVVLADVEGEHPHEAREHHFVHQEGMTRYHRAECLLASRWRTTTSSRQELERSGLVPCTTCEP